MRVSSWTCISTMTAASILALNSASFGQDVCGSSANDCCFGSGTPGCNDASCCTTVCGVDPFCCSVAWDGICAGEAATMCGDLCGSGGDVCGSSANDCCVAGSGPGCSDVTCCTNVCAVDPFCCSTAWDGICAGEAATLCLDLCGIACDTSCPPGGDTEDEACGDDTNGGCNTPPSGDSTCCFANGGIGCDDPTCQATVCGVHHEFTTNDAFSAAIGSA